MTLSFPKSERLCGKVAISALMSKGRWGYTSHLKYCFLKRPIVEDGESANRLLVSVPKRLFKRAVKRNLLKRRLREAYRTVKDILPSSGIDALLLYNSKTIIDFASLREEVVAVLKRLGDEKQR